jgi:hypothetical protein
MNCVCVCVCDITLLFRAVMSCHGVSVCVCDITLLFPAVTVTLSVAV